MVLPGTWSAVLLLLFISVLCLGVWPNLFKLAGPRWRFELFSFDFAAGALLLALIAAYTLGTMGSSLDFGDSMLVSGRRSEVIAFLAGGLFAFANMLYLGTIALIGLSSATLLTFSIFGCVVGLLHLHSGQTVTSLFAFLILAVAAFLVISAAKLRRPPVAQQTATVSVGAEPSPQFAPPRPAPPKFAQRPGTAPRPQPQRTSRPTRPQPQKVSAIAFSTKGTVTGILAGLSLAAIVPIMAMAQTVQLGIGAYGGLLMATLGMLVFTLLLNFFFLNVSLEGGIVKYSTYLTGTVREHVIGILSGVLWAVGALALYAALTGTVAVSALQSWLPPFLGAALTAISGIVFWQKAHQPEGSSRNTLLALILFVFGAGVLLAGMH